VLGPSADLRRAGEARFPVSATSIRRVLAEAKLEPAQRRGGPSWGKFLQAPAASVVACDFFTVESLLLPVRLVALRLMLRAVAGGLFHDAETWVRLVAATTHAAATIEGDTLEEERAAAASISALALTLMRGHIPNFHRWGPLRIPYERAAAQLDPLLEDVDEERIDRLSGELKAAFPALARLVQLNTTRAALARAQRTISEKACPSRRCAFRATASSSCASATYEARK
jgi:hypothetical protein